MLRPVTALFPLSLVLAPAMTHAADIEVLYSTIPGAPSSSVPGLSGELLTSFGNAARSPSGCRWIVKAVVGGDVTSEVVIVGTGRTGSAVLREGAPAPWAPSEIIERIDDTMEINSSGQFAFSANTDGPATTDEYVIHWNGASFEIAAQQGDPMPAPFAMHTLGSTLDSVQISEDGSVSHLVRFVPGLPALQDDFLINQGQIIAQSGVTVPTGPLNSDNITWHSWPDHLFRVNSDGARWIAQGQMITGPADWAVSVDGQMVLRIDTPIPNAPASFRDNIRNVQSINLTPRGDAWFAYGENDNDRDWVVRNGDVVASRGAWLVPGGPEFWSDAEYSNTYFIATGNDRGDYVIGGFTSEPVSRDVVIVLNGDTILLRQSDPISIDVNGDGVVETAIIDLFKENSMFLTDDGWLYFAAVLREQTGGQLGEAFLRMRIPLDCEADGDAGQVDVFDLLAYLDGWFTMDAAADLTGDAVIDVFDLLSFLDCWFDSSASSCG